MARPSCVVGHKDVVHDCSTPLRAKGSPNVKLHGVAWSCMGDVNTVHIYGPKCKNAHPAPIAQGSSTVKVNGVGAGRIGDKIAGCTVVAQGWNDILTGG